MPMLSRKRHKISATVEAKLFPFPDPKNLVFIRAVLITSLPASRRYGATQKFFYLAVDVRGRLVARFLSKGQAFAEGAEEGVRVRWAH